MARDLPARVLQGGTGVGAEAKTAEDGVPMVRHRSAEVSVRFIEEDSLRASEARLRESGGVASEDHPSWDSARGLSRGARRPG